MPSRVIAVEQPLPSSAEFSAPMQNATANSHETETEKQPIPAEPEEEGQPKGHLIFPRSPSVMIESGEWEYI